MKSFMLIVSFFFSSGRAQSQDLIAAAANNFLNSLDKDQKIKAQYPFISDERLNFHFVPRNDRKGISLNELTESQKKAAGKLLNSCLSIQGYQKTMAITQLEVLLKHIEKREASDHYRDPGKYFFTIFGIPGIHTTWGWRMEGHHVSFSFTAQNGRLISGTPGFLGSNPAIVLDGPDKGKQILKDETDLAFNLLHSFTKEQLQKVIFDSKAPAEIFTFNSRKAIINNPSGLSYAEMNHVQQEKYLGLIGVYIHRYTKLFAESMLKEIRQAGLDNLRFTWAGSQQPGTGNAHYYRIQGPTVIIEYDNTQNNANHVHSVVRDLLHDFGGDALLEHYQANH